MVITDHNFPAVLPTASGNCLAIMRIEHGNMKDLYDLLVSIAPETFPFGTIFLFGSLTQLQGEGLQGYSNAAIRYSRKIEGKFHGTTAIPFIPPPPWAAAATQTWLGPSPTDAAGCQKCPGTLFRNLWG